MSDHREHSAGTVSGCRQCAKIAYEPSLYATLLMFSRAPDTMRIDAAQIVST